MRLLVDAVDQDHRALRGLAVDQHEGVTLDVEQDAVLLSVVRSAHLVQTTAKTVHSGFTDGSLPLRSGDIGADLSSYLPGQ